MSTPFPATLKQLEYAAQLIEDALENCGDDERAALEAELDNIVHQMNELA